MSTHISEFTKEALEARCNSSMWHINNYKTLVSTPGVTTIQFTYDVKPRAYTIGMWLLLIPAASFFLTELAYKSRHGKILQKHFDTHTGTLLGNTLEEAAAKASQLGLGCLQNQSQSQRCAAEALRYFQLHRQIISQLEHSPAKRVKLDMEYKVNLNRASEMLDREEQQLAKNRREMTTKENEASTESASTSTSSGVRSRQKQRIHQQQVTSKSSVKAQVAQNLLEGAAHFENGWQAEFNDCDKAESEFLLALEKYEKVVKLSPTRKHQDNVEMVRCKIQGNIHYNQAISFYEQGKNYRIDGNFKQAKNNYQEARSCLITARELFQQGIQYDRLQHGERFQNCAKDCEQLNRNIFQISVAVDDEEVKAKTKEDILEISKGIRFLQNLSTNNESVPENNFNGNSWARVGEEHELDSFLLQEFD